MNKRPSLAHLRHGLKELKIPAEWRVAHLGDVASLSYSNVDKKTKTGEAAVYLCNYTDVFYNEKITLDMEFMRASATAREIEKFTLLKDDVVFTKDSEDPLEIGVPTLIAEDIPGLVCGYHLGIARPKKGVIGHYICLALQTDSARRQLACIARGVSRFGLSRNEIERLTLFLPPLAEQERIAEILSVTDAAISTAEKLLVSIEIRNKNLLSQFLASDLQTNWETKRLDDLLLITKGEQLNRVRLSPTGQYPVYSGGIGPSGYFDRWNTEANTLTISEGGNSCGYVRFITERFWSGGHCYTLEIKERGLNVKLVYFLLKAKEQEIMHLRVGSGLPNVQASSLSAFKIQLPPTSMRGDILAALNHAEREYEQVMLSVIALKKQKRGLLQQLLTGKLRIPLSNGVKT